jgi:hypothetical protein
MNFPFTLAAQAHVAGARATLKRWEQGLEQATMENDAAGIEFCERCVKGAKERLEQAKEEALDITLW